MALLDYTGPGGTTIDKVDGTVAPARQYRTIGGGDVDLNIVFKEEDDTGMRAEHALLAILAERVREKMLDDTNGHDEALAAITKINSAMIYLERYLIAVNE